MKKKTMAERPPLTIDDVAEAAGVSRSTVSLVLRNSPLVATSTTKKVRETMARLGYVYNRKAAIRAKLSYLVGIVIPDLTNPFFSELTAGIDNVLNEAGWISLLGNSWESVANQARILHRMREQMVDAAIVCPAVDSASTPEALSLPGLFVLQVLRRTDSVANYLGIDYAHGVSLAVDHLHELGHRAIVFFGGDRDHSAAVERHNGYEAAMRRHRLRPSYAPCPLTRAGAAEAILALLARRPAPTALICFNDIVAMGAMAGLERLGLEVGGDVSVVGFDNVPETEFVTPALTTIDSNARQLGAEAARLVLSSIRSGVSFDGRTVKPTTLVVRDSTGPAPTR